VVWAILDSAEGIRVLYQLTAPRYEADIAPLMDALVSNLARWITACLQAHQRGALFDPFDLPDVPVRTSPAGVKRPALQLLDLGAGTGALSHHLMVLGWQALTALDLSPEMLSAGQKSHSQMRWLQANLHQIPLKPHTFDGAVSAFGLNATSPKLSLRQIKQTLRPGGLLMYQEWGAEDELSHLVEETLDQFAPDLPLEANPALVAFMESPKVWYEQLQDADDHTEMLRQIGFDLAWAQERSFVSSTLPVEQFLRGKLAWGWRRLRLETLPPPQQALFYAHLQEALRPHQDSQGNLRWSPPLIRVCALKE